MSAAPPLTARLLRWHEIAPEVRHFDFEIEGQEEFRFAPGQWVSLSREVNSKVITRAYSLAGPAEANRFSLCLNLVQDGALSPFLFSLQPGDAVNVRGPLGDFTLRHPERDLIMVATGTGIAPFRSMLLGQRAAITGRVALLLGVRYEESILYREEFERLARDWPAFEFRPVVSRPSPGWTGRTGHVQPHVVEAVGERRDLDVYLCGLRAMVDDVRRLLLAAGFNRRQIFYEKYD